MLCVQGNQHLSQLYPNYMSVVLNSMLLWADARVNSIVIACRNPFEFHDCSCDSIFILKNQGHNFFKSYDDCCEPIPIQSLRLLLWDRIHLHCIIVAKERHPSRFYVFCCCGSMSAEVSCLWSCSSIHPTTMFLVVEASCGPTSMPDLRMHVLTWIVVARFSDQIGISCHAN